MVGCCLDHERAAPPGDAPVEQLESDEPATIVRVAGQPFHLAVALELAAEPLRSAGSGEAGAGFFLVPGILVHPGDLERARRNRHWSPPLGRRSMPARRLQEAIRRAAVQNGSPSTWPTCCLRSVP